MTHQSVGACGPRLPIVRLIKLVLANCAPCAFEAMNVLLVWIGITAARAAAGGMPSIVQHTNRLKAGMRMP